jgi:hypothetical protein
MSETGNKSLQERIRKLENEVLPIKESEKTARFESTTHSRHCQGSERLFNVR